MSIFSELPNLLPTYVHKEKQTERLTHTQTDRKADRQTETETHTPTKRRTDPQTHRRKIGETERKTDRYTEDTSRDRES